MVAWLDGLSSATVVIAGILLVALGVVAVAFGVAGGIAQMIKELRKMPKASSGADFLKPFETLIKALTEFLRALTHAPHWLALVFVGFLLVGGGAWLIGQA